MRDEWLHGLQSRLLDRHGLASRKATVKLIEIIRNINPDIVHLHNIHGYYLNYPILFAFLSQYNKPVVWTLHDCWPITGHCAYFTYAQCEKWKIDCNFCEHTYTYPRSYFACRSKKNLAQKKESFCSLEKLTIVPVSMWLEDIIHKSYLAKYPVRMIYNGIDIEKFWPTEDGIKQVGGKKIVLGVSSIWEKRKGLNDFFALRQLLDDEYEIVIVGLSKSQKNSLPDGIIGVDRTNSLDELRNYYNQASVYVNSTYEDNFPTTNIEALSCGTPVITYNTGGSPEAIDEETGAVVECGNVAALADAIHCICKSPAIKQMRKACRQRAVSFFDKRDRYQEYIDIYKQLL